MMNARRTKILIAGGAGYIGSHMVKLLQKHKYQPIIIDNLSTGFRNLIQADDFFQGNLGDSALLSKIFSEHRIEAVMHFAAFSLVGESVTTPIKYYRNNISETISLIENMLKHHVRHFIFSSTAAVYGEPRQIPIPESHPCRPSNPYGATKLAVERLLQDCSHAYGLNFACLRYFNAAGADEDGKIGEMHHPETHLIPLVLKSALHGTPIDIFGTDYATIDGTCIRDFIHVSDLAQAHLVSLEALMNGRSSNIYNLGNSIGHSVRQVIETARKVTEKPVKVVEKGRRLGDPAVLIADSQRIKNDLNWRPEYEDLEKIIETAWHWEKSRSS
jgi:UDP-glucose 4-epimerase